MSMSDADYQRVVEELKASKAGRLGPEWNFLYESIRSTAAGYVGYIGSILGYRLNGRRQEGPFTAAMARAAAVAKRIRELGIHQVREDLADLCCDEYSKLEKLIPPTPEAFDLALARIQADVEVMARRAF